MSYISTKIAGVLKISSLEIRKSRKKYDRQVLIVTVLIILISSLTSLHSLSDGFDPEIALYTINSDVKIENPKFIRVNSDADIYFQSGVIFVKRTDKSIAAADELVTYLKSSYREEIERKFGERAYPIIVGIDYVRRGELKIQEAGAPSVAEKIEEKTAMEIGAGEGRVEYRTPENIKMPRLLEKLMFAFAFLIPAYFTSQISSSSLLEDKMSRRLEVLLPACSAYQLIIGKILPYVLISVLASIAISIYFSVPLAFIFAIPVILLLFSAQQLVAIISRSYREATFLLLVVSLFITIYIFMPAVFSGSIPISKISPVTLMLEYTDGRIDPEFIILSFSHILLMSAMLLYLSSNSLDLDVLYGTSIAEKFFTLSKNLIRKPWQSFVYASLSIPFAFMAEFFLLILLFVLPPPFSLPFLILAIAVVEETIKGLIISARVEMVFTVATALGFFAGEKALIVFSLMKEYSTAFLGQYLLLPAILHLSTAILFRYMLKRGFGISLLLASLLHFLYNYAVVLILAS